jgi:hypothetical protein
MVELVETAEYAGIALETAVVPGVKTAVSLVAKMAAAEIAGEKGMAEIAVKVVRCKEMVELAELVVSVELVESAELVEPVEFLGPLGNSALG